MIAVRHKPTRVGHSPTYGVNSIVSSFFSIFS